MDVKSVGGKMSYIEQKMGSTAKLTTKKKKKKLPKFKENVFWKEVWEEVDIDNPIMKGLGDLGKS